MEARGFLALSFVTVLCSLTLQGCEFNIPRHLMGNWESKPSYLTRYEFLVPGTSNSILNSCSDTKLPSDIQCSGHGRCRNYFSSKGPNAPRLAFCSCELYWAGPECSTPRKSQMTAFILSLFLGMFGVDQFYLGYTWYGIAKLLISGGGGLWYLYDHHVCRIDHSKLLTPSNLYSIAKVLTLGGGAFWYLYDLCRIGSSTVLTPSNFRVAQDLPHFVFVLAVITAMLFFGFLLSLATINGSRAKKSHEVATLSIQHGQQEEQPKEEPKEEPPVKRHLSPPVMAPPTTPLKPFVPFTGYGTTLESVPTTTRILSAGAAVPTEYISAPVNSIPTVLTGSPTMPVSSQILSAGAAVPTQYFSAPVNSIPRVLTGSPTIPVGNPILPAVRPLSSTVI